MIGQVAGSYDESFYFGINSNGKYAFKLLNGTEKSLGVTATAGKRVVIGLDAKSGGYIDGKWVSSVFNTGFAASFTINITLFYRNVITWTNSINVKSTNGFGNMYLHRVRVYTIDNGNSTKIHDFFPCT